jgi:uncharacterized Zn-binding protein involved in type VI secretion
MAKRSIIRYGDRTTHGGTVVSADPTYEIYGKSVARVGDRVACPRCKGTFPIVTGAPDAWSGQSIARQDDITACGAKLIASQSTATIDDGSAADTSVAAAPSPIQQVGTSLPCEDEIHAIRFQALNPETGAPESRCIYILTRENGAQHGGITDHAGFTEIIETTKPEQIGVHFMFKSPKGDTIDREALTE